MLLATANAQGELSALERGMHALRSGLGVREYADHVAMSPQTVSNQFRAAKVYETVCTDIGTDITPWFSRLIEIHSAPTWLWPGLVAAMLGKAWSVFGYWK